MPRRGYLRRRVDPEDLGLLLAARLGFVVLLGLRLFLLTSGFPSLLRPARPAARPSIRPPSLTIPALPFFPELGLSLCLGAALRAAARFNAVIFWAAPDPAIFLVRGLALAAVLSGASLGLLPKGCRVPRQPFWPEGVLRDCPVDFALLLTLSARSTAGSLSGC